jgi:hypothetical protein
MKGNSLTNGQEEELKEQGDDEHVAYGTAMSPSTLRPRGGFSYFSLMSWKSGQEGVPATKVALGLDLLIVCMYVVLGAAVGHWAAGGGL